MRLVAQIFWVLAAVLHLVVVVIAGFIYRSAGLHKIPFAFPDLWRFGAAMVAIDALVSVVRVAANCSLADLLGWTSLLLSCVSGALSALLAYGLWNKRGVIAILGAALLSTAEARVAVKGKEETP